MNGLCISTFKNYSSIHGTSNNNGTALISTNSFHGNININCPTHRSFPNIKLFSAHSLKISCSASALSTAVVGDQVEEKREIFDVEKARVLVQELQGVFNSGRTKSYEWRISQLNSISKMLVEKEKDITAALYKDLSKPEIEAFVSEEYLMDERYPFGINIGRKISTTKASCKHALEELSSWMQPEKVQTSITTYPSSAEIVTEPLGVVLVIATWNFPFLLSIDPVIGAISAGNAVVLKPSEIAPATSKLLAKLLEEYLDNSAIRVVEGAIPETTALLDQKWDKILYTGSAKVARIVMAAAAKHLTPVILELGGKCPAVVDSDINLQVASRRIIAGKWALNNGQACIGVDYIITTKDFAPKLIDALVNEIEKGFGKNPIESKDKSRIVSPSHFGRLVKLIDEDEVSKKIVYGGQRDENQLLIAPTIILNPPEDSEIMKDEIFGPIMPILTVDKIEDSFGVIKSKPKPLVAYLFTNDEQLKKNYVQNISSGGMLVNDTVLHLTVKGLPFGGVGESGMGSYHGKFSFDGFSHKKAVMYRSFGGDAPIRYPPYTPEKQKLFKVLISGNIFRIFLTFFGFV